MPYQNSEALPLLTTVLSTLSQTAIWCPKMSENDKTHFFCTKKALSESCAQGEACKALSLNY